LHEPIELERALALSTPLIGINNATEDLRGIAGHHAQPDARNRSPIGVVIAESGVLQKEDRAG